MLMKAIGLVKEEPTSEVPEPENLKLEVKDTYTMHEGRISVGNDELESVE